MIVTDKRIGIIIPARYESTRFPGKPMVDILGKTMIQRTWSNCCSAIHKDQVYVATDNETIASHIKNIGGNVILTSSDNLTGTDRVAEANQTLGFDIVINVQGDEPIIDPSDIKKVIESALENPNLIINGYARISDDQEYYSRTVPKVVFSTEGVCLYMSRSPIPGSKTQGFGGAFKQICVYAFPKEALQFFSEFNSKTPLEEVEDIEILRLVESDLKVKMVELSGSNLAIDVPEDLDKLLLKMMR